MTRLLVHADLRLHAGVDGPRPGTTTTMITGRVQASGSTVSVTLSQTPSLLGLRGPAARSIARLLADHGLTVELIGPRGRVAIAGSSVSAPWWQLPVTRSRRLRLGSARAVVGSLRGPRLFDVAWPTITQRKD